MSHLFQEQLDYVCLVYLVGSGILAANCFRLNSGIGPRLPWGWISRFALAQSLNGLLGLVACSVADSAELAVMRIVLEMLSATCLVEFARRASRQAWGREIGLWVHIPLAMITTAWCALSPNDYIKGSLSAIVTIAGLWATVVLLKLAFSRERSSRAPMLFLGIAVALYAAATVIAAHDPSVNAKTLPTVGLHVVGLPLKLVEGILYFVASSALFLWRRDQESSLMVMKVTRRPMLLALCGVILSLSVGWICAQEFGDSYIRDSRSQLEREVSLAAQVLSSMEVPRDKLARHRHIRRALLLVLGNIRGGRTIYLADSPLIPAYLVVDINAPRRGGSGGPTMPRLAARFAHDEPVWRSRAIVVGPEAAKGEVWASAMAPMLVFGGGDSPGVLSIDVDASGWLNVRTEHRLIVISFVLFLCGIAMTLGFVTDGMNISRMRLAASELKYRSLVDGSPVAMVLHDLDGAILDVNRQACESLRGERNQLIGMSVARIDGSLSPERLRSIWERIVTSRTPVSMASRQRRLDGTEFPVDLRLSGFEWGGRRLILTLAQDVSVLRQAESELRESEGKFRTLAESAGVAISIVQGRRLTYVNPYLRTLSGYSNDELLSMDFETIIHPEERSKVLDRAMRRQAGESLPSHYLIRMLTKSGETRWLDFTAGVTEFRGSVSTVCVCSDVTERVAAEHSLRESEERYRIVAEQTGQLIYDYDPQKGRISWSGAIEAITGFAVREFLGMRVSQWIRYVHPEDRQRALALFQRAHSSEAHCSIEFRFRRKDGVYIVLENHGSWLRDTAGRAYRFVGSMKDVTEKQGYESQLRHMAHHDALTDLPNRLQFREHLKQRLEQAEKEGTALAVVFVDLDRFKLINDTLGHNIGDLLLKEVSNRLPSCLRPSDLIARMGGDEFTIVLWNIEDRKAAAAVAHRILESLTAPFEVSGQELVISASIGISMYPDDGTDVETLVKNADTAMYRAKEQGRCNCQFYTKDLSATVVERMQMLNSLRRAAERNEFVAHYQPILEMQAGEIVGAEALVRWNHPEHGLLPPDRFIPLAEESGLVGEITEFVLRAACSYAATWDEGPSGPVGVAVNVSPAELSEGTLVPTVRKALSEGKIDPGQLTVEITETALAQNPEVAVEALNELKSLGVKIALDDFGSGYSSLNTLKRFPVDILKMDKSFVKEITLSADDAAIAQAIITMAHSLNLQVVAEGVETLEQLELLSALRCDRMQGYFIGRPVPAREFSALIQPRERYAKSA